MISIQTINEIANTIKSRYLSALQSLSTIAATLRDEWTIENKLLNFAADIFSCHVVNNDEDTINITPETMDMLEEMERTAHSVFINVSATRVIEIASTYDPSVDEYAIKVDGQYIGKVSQGQMDDINPYNAQRLAQFTSTILSLAEAVGCKFALAEIADVASMADWTSDTNVSNSLYAKVNEYRNILGLYTNDLISAIAKGPLALLQVLSSLIEKVKEQLDNSNLSKLMNSTNIVLNHFAWGIVAQTAGSVISALSLVVMGFSRIAGAIVAVSGLILQIVGRIAVSATTAFDDTQFKVYSGSDVVHAFAFVLDQGRVTNAGLASFMREHGWNTMTVFCPHQASVYLMYLEDYDDPTNNIVHYESHLSSDIDVSQQLYEMPIGDTAYKMPYISFNHDSVSSDDKPCGIGYYPPVNSSQDGYYQTSFWMTKYLGNAGTTNGNIALTLRRNVFYTKMISPVDFSLFDSLKQWYANDLTNFLDVRLCSSLIIWCAYRLSAIVQLSEFSGASETAWGIRLYGPWSDTIIARVLALYNLAWSCFVTGSGVGSTSYLRSTFGLSSTNRDAVLGEIENFFDELNYKATVVAGVVSAKLVHAMSSGSSLVFSENSWYSNISETIQNNMCDGSSYLASIFPSYDNADYIHWCSGVWNNHFAIDLPTLTFNGFIFGLIVDGLLLAATAIVATAVVAGWIAIRNYRARLQAQAEYAWYNYQDNGQTDALWKDYKANRFKYNVIALATGGSTLKLGLYDDDNSVGSIITAIKGVFQSGEHDDDVDLKTIVKLIKGSV